MKKFIFFALIIFATNANAQITLEHVYDSASTATYSNYVTCIGEESQLLIVNFAISGYRYVKINRCGQIIQIYDMSHTLLKTIQLGIFGLDGNGLVGDVLYLSQGLFDTDSTIDFMYITNVNNQFFKTQIINENGVVLFSDTGGAVIRTNFELQQYPIYNTPVGTKMILSYSTGQAKVFSLKGTLTSTMEETNKQLAQGNGSLNNLYPNPSNGEVTLQYQLPPGIHDGQIILYDMQGNQLKTYKVDDTFTSLLLNNTQLPAGNYFYQLSTSTGLVGTKKMVVMK
jgi:hypothetical protein